MKKQFDIDELIRIRRQASAEIRRNSEEREVDTNTTNTETEDLKHTVYNEELIKAIDGVTLVLPADTNSKNSKVLMSLSASGTPVKDISISHRDASFLYFLGIESKRGGSAWLDAPEQHRELLLKIFNSLCLPEAFEEELNMVPPIKGNTSTWIWDVENEKRKGHKNQINRKLKDTLPESMRIEIIVSKLKSQNDPNGIYELNPNIISFEVKTPSK